MKVVILAGGLGTRISEESHLRPKPMIEIGGMPILWHIMKIYSSHGLNDFVICCGYKGYVIKEFFANYFLHTSDVTFDLAKTGPVEVAIYDVRGQLVQKLASGTMNSGRHDLVWQGRDDAGRSVASGVYFCRLAADGAVQSRKMILAR